MATFLSFLVNEAFILISVVLGFLVMFHIMQFGNAVTLLFNFVIVLILIPFLSTLLDFFPLWALSIIFFIFCFSLIRSITEIIFGGGVSDHFWGNIIYRLFTFPFKVISWILRRPTR